MLACTQVLQTRSRCARVRVSRPARPAPRSCAAAACWRRRSMRSFAPRPSPGSRRRRPREPRRAHDQRRVGDLGARAVQALGAVDGAQVAVLGLAVGAEDVERDRAGDAAGVHEHDGVRAPVAGQVGERDVGRDDAAALRSRSLTAVVVLASASSVFLKSACDFEGAALDPPVVSSATAAASAAPRARRGRDEGGASRALSQPRRPALRLQELVLRARPRRAHPDRRRRRSRRRPS